MPSGEFNEPTPEKVSAAEVETKITPRRPEAPAPSRLEAPTPEITTPLPIPESLAPEKSASITSRTPSTQKSNTSPSPNRARARSNHPTLVRRKKFHNPVRTRTASLSNPNNQETKQSRLVSPPQPPSIRRTSHSLNLQAKKRSASVATHPQDNSVNFQAKKNTYSQVLNKATKTASKNNSAQKQANKKINRKSTGHTPR